MAKYIDADSLLERLNACKYPVEKTTMRQVTYNAAISDVCRSVDAMPAADVVEIKAFRNEVYRYIDDYKDDGADFLAGLETAVVIAEKMAGVYEEVEE